jgi:SAM-dependent methyltransferase
MVTDYLPAMAEGIQTIDNPAALVYVCQTNSDPSTKELFPMTWTSGYVADIGYTYGYYNELNPLRVKPAFLNNGLVFPEVSTACELGFGQGLSANLHAAAGTTQWWGTDFNPSQAGFARDLAAVSGSGARLYDDAFADFTNRPDLPAFDYIGIHGIWSWISDDNRQVLVDFVRRKLAVGGVLYISYNTLPGWAAFAPMRHLMTEHSEIIGAEGSGIVSRIDGAIEFAQKLQKTNPLFSRANPLVGDRIKKIKDQNRHYLAHEYFNKSGIPCILPLWQTGWNRPGSSMPAPPIFRTILTAST